MSRKAGIQQGVYFQEGVPLNVVSIMHKHKSSRKKVSRVRPHPCSILTLRVMSFMMCDSLGKDSGRSARARPYKKDTSITFSYYCSISSSGRSSRARPRKENTSFAFPNSGRHGCGSVILSTPVRCVISHCTAMCSAGIQLPIVSQ